VTLVAGTGDMTLHFGGFSLSGISTAPLFAIVLYQILDRRRPAA
jgi:putative pyrimidine permease RutG